MENPIYKISKEKHINTTEHKETNRQQVVIATGLFVDKLADNKDIISCCCDIVYTCVGEEEESSMCDYNNTLSGKCHKCFCPLIDKLIIKVSYRY